MMQKKYTEIQNKIDILEKKNYLSFLGGGEKKIDIQHSLGKLTARERINILFDENSFVEMDRFRIHRCDGLDKASQTFLGDGVIIGFGLINGYKVGAYSQDFTIFGGSLSETVAEKICKIYKLCIKLKLPIISLNDSGGARIQEGVVSLAGYSDIFYLNSISSGLIPQISIIMGPSAGGAVYSPALNDFIIMVENTSYMFLTGPEVIKTVTHEIVTKESLGGCSTHTEKSGVAHFSCSNDIDAIETSKKLVSYIQNQKTISNDDYKTSHDLEDRSIDLIIPCESTKPYNVKLIIDKVVDENSFFEVSSNFAKNIVVGFATILGKTTGVVANQANFLAGAIDIDASDKSSRFIRFCDAFNIPIITLVDTPGFLPGVKQEHNGIIRHGAKLLYAYSEATVPKITVILRKAYGGAYCVMGSKHLGADFNFAFPTAEIAVIGAEAAYNIIHGKNIDYSSEIKKEKFISDYKEKFQNPYRAAEFGYIDEIITPSQLKYKIIRSLELLQTKYEKLPIKKHGNIPL